MSSSNNGSGITVTYENIVKFVRRHEDPVVTASEIAEAFDMTNEGVNYRLQKLRERGELVEKRAGASAKVWYPAEMAGSTYVSD